jgi:hypothetical protein
VIELEIDSQQDLPSPLLLETGKGIAQQGKVKFCCSCYLQLPVFLQEGDQKAYSLIKDSHR